MQSTSQIDIVIQKISNLISEMLETHSSEFIQKGNKSDHPPFIPHKISKSTQL